MKIILDVILAVVGVIALSPLFLIIAILVKSNLGGAVFFRQQRPGLNAKPFFMCKFRTMSDARDAAGNLLPDEKRLNGFGKFLRSSSLDELPELFNVVKCEMSLVGPRPLLMEYLPLYSWEESVRHSVRPGITGWAQINGRNGLSWAEKFRLDVWYVRNRTFWLDVKILFRTLLTVLMREGVNQTGHVTVEKFTGNN